MSRKQRKSTAIIRSKGVGETTGAAAGARNRVEGWRAWVFRLGLAVFTPLLALTATAPTRVRRDILHRLGDKAAQIAAPHVALHDGATASPFARDGRRAFGFHHL